MKRQSFAAIVVLLAVAALFVRHHRHHPNRQPVATIASWAQPGAPGSQPAPSGFTDPTGQHTMCGIWEGEFPQICDQGGRVVGIYIDDTAPNQADWVGEALADQQTVFVGIPPVAGAGSACPYSQTGVMCLQEYYPYDCRNLGVWGPLPRLSGNTDGFILQNRFAWPGCGPPTSSEVQHLVALAELQHPTLILLY